MTSRTLVRTSRAGLGVEFTFPSMVSPRFREKGQECRVVRRVEIEEVE